MKQAELDKVRDAKESRTIEFFMGSPDDEAALFFYNGILEALQEYLDVGTLICRFPESLPLMRMLLWMKIRILQ